MAATHLIATRVSEETKVRFRSLSERQEVSESVLLKRLIHSALQGVGRSDAEVLKAPARRLRGARLCVRLHPDDQALLIERAAARQMAAATYVSVLVRVHLRALSPLPKAELVAFKRAVAELNAIGRNLNQLARAAHQRGPQAESFDDTLMAILKVCEVMRTRIKDLIKGNTRAWEVGHANVSS